MAQFQKDKNTLTQSEYLYLQAVGSSGIEGISKGIHLRWGLRGRLGEEHLPKGNLAQSAPYQTNIGFNKPNDYVEIYRRPIGRLRPRTFILNDLKISQIQDGGENKDWVYLDNDGTLLTVRFTNPNEYETLKQQFDLIHHITTAPAQILQQYHGVIEVHLNKKFFGVQIVSKNIQDYHFGLEGISERTDTNTSKVISFRDIVDIQQTSLNFTFYEENLKSIRFSGIHSPSIELNIYLYEDAIFGPKWNKIDGFSLSLDTNEVLNKRLQDIPRVSIENWPKFNQGALVNVQNYFDRWDVPNSDADTKGAIEKYLTASKTDPLAVADFSQDNPAESNGSTDQATLQMSMLKILQLMALDYHVARMLGLGYIDTPKGEGRDSYLYLAKYTTETPLEQGGEPQTKTHFFMSLPTSLQDTRPPIIPNQEALSFGLYYEQGQGQKVYITDKNGYSLTESKRYVRVNMEAINFPHPFESFFADNDPIDASKHTAPVAFGLEYKNTGQNWVKPELSHDNQYDDPSGVAETEMILFKGENPLFVHGETHNGSHTYALYSINWFARPSALSNTRQETTNLPSRIKPLPPFNVHPQLIQKENPLIFTTQNEQTMLQNISNSDKTLLRVQLTIDQRHNISDNEIDKIQFYFRENSVGLVEGKIKSVTSLSPDSCRIRTESYTKASVNVVITPSIQVGNEGNYVGSFLVVEDRPFQILQVQQSTVSGEGPVFDVLKIQENAVIPTGNGQQSIATEYISPQNDKKFTAAENLNNTGLWNQLSKEVEIIHFSNHQETKTLADGTTVTLNIGGVYESATIQERPGMSGNFYDVAFNNYNLSNHPDQDVKWKSGTARIPIASNPSELKQIEVVEIDTSGSTLKLVVYDESNADPIKTGANIEVNFFPGYQIYLYAESGFGEPQILPQQGEGTKTTYLATRSNDTTNAVKSYISQPRPIIAREIIVPKQPEQPIGNLYSNRPNFYGKSGYTFDTQVNTSNGRQPFALVFYRGNTQSVLNALYEDATIQNIRSSMEALQDDSYFNNRWNDLVLVDYDSTTKQFKTYPGNNYYFPNPDKSPNFDSSTNPGSSSTYADKIKNAILKSFTPLTEQPVLYDFLDEGKETSPKKPKIKDEYGNALPPSSPEFDQAPMACKFEDNGDWFVRFTDFNLDGATAGYCFYAARELSNVFTFSDYSIPLGPIRILNTKPFAAPVIQKIESLPANPLLNSPVSVGFEIGQYHKISNVTHVKIYRTTNIDKAQSIRTMKLAGDTAIPLTDDLRDDFSDLSDIPYSEPLFYRLVASKTMINEEGNNELVDSLPSNIVMSNVIDNSIPIAPDLSASYDGPSGSPQEITNVKIRWEKVVQNAKYILYKMNDSGNWDKIHTETGNNSPTIEVSLSNTSLGSGSLFIEDADGNTIYHHFKVEVVNASGLISQEEKIYTINQ